MGVVCVAVDVGGRLMLLALCPFAGVAGCKVDAVPRPKNVDFASLITGLLVCCCCCCRKLLRNLIVSTTFSY